MSAPSAPPGGRTFHHRNFDVASLVAAKDGRTVSVVIPARDEAATVGEVVAMVAALAGRGGLVDEVVVVDGDSQDRTREIAERAGARVVRQSEVLPQAGSAPGKGEALWKGVAVSTGDLVAFVDADVHDPEPRLVTGLLGPLLTADGVRFVKAAYDRPLTLGAEVRPSGGGRVTELMARPLLTTFWPELAWVAQPLSGEYAADRELLEALPFVRGYGVELALLVDVAARFGTEVIAQVDLGARAHAHQPLEALGRMATEILQVAVARLERQGRLEVAGALGGTLWQPRRDTGGALTSVASDVGWSERPPLREWRG